MIKYLLSKNRAEQGRMFAVVVLAALVALLPIHLFRLIIDTAIPGHDRMLLLSLCALLLLALIVGAWCHYLQAVLARRIQEFFVADMRLMLMAHIMDLPTEYFATNPVGKLVNRIMHDVARFGMGIEWLLVNPVVAVATLIFYTAYLLSIDPLLTLLALLPLPPLLWSTSRTSTTLSRHRATVVEAAGNFSASVNELMLAAMEVQSNGTYRHADSRLQVDHAALSRAGIREASLLARIATASGMYRELVPVIVYVYGAWLAMDGAMTVGRVVAFAAAFGGLYRAIDTLITYLPIYQNVRDRFGELRLILDKKGIGPAPLEPTVEGVVPGTGIQLDAVSFSHVSGARILDSVQLTIAAGEHVALIGRSGCGKSTLLNLVAGRLQPDGGAIRYGALVHSQLERDKRVALISYVQQSPFLFSATLRANLLYGVAGDGQDATRSDEELLALCSKAGLAPDLLQFGLEACVTQAQAVPYLPLRQSIADSCAGSGIGSGVQMGWDAAQTIHANLMPAGVPSDDVVVTRTVQQAIMTAAVAAGLSEPLGRLGMDFDVGERGARLSGGQRQKVSIVRALVRRRPILLLDEVTASLDRDSARAVMGLLHTELCGVTVIAITHELDLLGEFDRVIALRDGVVAADLVPAALLGDQVLLDSVLCQPGMTPL